MPSSDPQHCIVAWNGPSPLEKEFGVPNALYAELRQSAPLAKVSTGQIFCTRYDDVAHALGSWSQFPGSLLEEGTTITEEELAVIQMDEPRHSIIRRLFYAGVTKSRIAPYEEPIRRSCEQAMDWIIAQDRPVDFVEHYIRWTPITTIARIIGVPEADWDRLDRWVDEISNSDWLTHNRGPDGHGIVAGFREFSAYMSDLLDEASARAGRSRRSRCLPSSPSCSRQAATPRATCLRTLSCTSPSTRRCWSTCSVTPSALLPSWRRCCACTRRQQPFTVQPPAAPNLGSARSRRDPGPSCRCRQPIAIPLCSPARRMRTSTGPICRRT